MLAHGILDAVDDLAEAFAAIVGAVRPGGLLSVLVGNPVAAVLGRALAGELDAAERELAALDDAHRGAGSATPDAVARLCAAHGLAVEQQHGIGVFRELVPGRALDSPGRARVAAALGGRLRRAQPVRPDRRAGPPARPPAATG